MLPQQAALPVRLDATSQGVQRVVQVGLSITARKANGQDTTIQGNNMNKILAIVGNTDQCSTVVKMMVIARKLKSHFYFFE